MYEDDPRNDRGHDDEYEPRRGATLDTFLLERRKRQMRQALIVLAIVLPGLIGILYLARGPKPVPEIVEVVKVVEVKPEPEPVVRKPPPPPPEGTGSRAIRTPPARRERPFVRALAEALSKRPEVAVWLLSENLVRRFVAAVDAVATGQSPRGQLRMMWPRGKFKVSGEIFQEPVYIDPASYKRYDAIAEAFVSLDVQSSVAIYRKIMPMIDAAYADLGYPDHDFNATMLMAIEELLNAPVIVGDATLEPRVLSYAYEDANLEGLSNAQKQIMRMGPANMQRVQKKLRAFATALGASSASLPKSRIYNATPRVARSRARGSGARGEDHRALGRAFERHVQVDPRAVADERPHETRDALECERGHDFRLVDRQREVGQVVARVRPRAEVVHEAGELHERLTLAALLLHRALDEAPVAVALEEGAERLLSDRAHVGRVALALEFDDLVGELVDRSERVPQRGHDLVLVERDRFRAERDLQRLARDAPGILESVETLPALDEARTLHVPDDIGHPPSPLGATCMARLRKGNRMAGGRALGLRAPISGA